MEFQLYGDLKTYLLARRHLANGKIIDDSDISPKRLTIMALDVARALSYLADMKYVHRDIACRNCLRIVKLGDFGMARPMFENDYYQWYKAPAGRFDECMLEFVVQKATEYLRSGRFYQ